MEPIMLRWGQSEAREMGAESSSNLKGQELANGLGRERGMFSIVDSPVYDRVPEYGTNREFRAMRKADKAGPIERLVSGTVPQYTGITVYSD